MDLFVEPGHFYSPIALLEDGEQLKGWGPRLNEINLNIKGQLSNLRLISSLGTVFEEDKNEDSYYFSKNDQFAEGDSFVYSGLLKLIQPRKVVEIGSGYSTAVLYDTKTHLKRLNEIVLIEPYPDRLMSLLDLDSSTRLIQSNVQDVPIEVFSALRSGDILFIDSSHVAKTNSDVLFEIFSILPNLAKGVWVHIHDTFWPFEYPEAWVRQGRSWNELYFLRSWLAYNNKVSIQFFNHYLFSEHRKEWGEQIPVSVVNPGGGLWLRVER
jgi:predicted O-methyltransferase YrrM